MSLPTMMIVFEKAIQKSMTRPSLSAHHTRASYAPFARVLSILPSLAFLSLPRRARSAIWPVRTWRAGRGDAVRELVLRRVASVVVQGLEPASVLFELLAQQVVVGWLPGEPIPVLGEHQRDSALSHEGPYLVYPRSFQRDPTLPGIADLFHDLIAFSEGVFA